jgi:sugar O-acyltransferase (sialic acid O-acetyltransferase NeuD family)
MDNRPALVLVGAGGHAKAVIDAIEKEGRYRISNLLDDNPDLHGKPFFGYEVTGATESILVRASAERERPMVFVSIGDNAARVRISNWLRSKGFELARAVHPHAQVGRGATIGAGSVLMAGAVVNSDATIGENVIINTGATVDHDCVIGDGVLVAPGAHLCGGVRVGAGSAIGAGAVLIPGVHVGTNTLIGAGSTLLEDVADNAKAAGSPARKISA